MDLFETWPDRLEVYKHMLIPEAFFARTWGPVIIHHSRLRT
jgi:hypothetical protein